MSAPKVAVIILCWNGLADTLECLASLKEVRYPNMFAVLVDNGSTDGTTEAVKSRYPDIEVVALKENTGVAKGNNIGIKEALRLGADAVLLLNNDTTLEPDFLIKLTDALFREEDIGAVNPAICYYDEPEVLWSAGGRIDTRTGIAYQLGLNEKTDFLLSCPANIDYGVGAALLIKKEALRTVGLLDCDYFMYYEETDWCLRARKSGFRILLAPEARVFHKVSRSIKNDRPAQLYYFCRNRLLFMRKNLRAGALGKTALEFGRLSASLALRGRRKESRAVLKAVCDFYLGRSGKASL